VSPTVGYLRVLVEPRRDEPDIVGKGEVVGRKPYAAAERGELPAEEIIVVSNCFTPRKTDRGQGTPKPIPYDEDCRPGIVTVSTDILSRDIRDEFLVSIFLPVQN
jgi:hypothetical protein